MVLGRKGGGGAWTLKSRGQEAHSDNRGPGCCRRTRVEYQKGGGGIRTGPLARGRVCASSPDGTPANLKIDLEITGAPRMAAGAGHLTDEAPARKNSICGRRRLADERVHGKVFGPAEISAMVIGRSSGLLSIAK